MPRRLENVTTYMNTYVICATGSLYMQVLLSGSNYNVHVANTTWTVSIAYLKRRVSNNTTTCVGWYATLMHVHAHVYICLLYTSDAADE